MASRGKGTKTRSPAPTRRVDGDGEGEPDSVVRRAPFSDNPEVGARGQRTQLRILDAALEVFGEVGYDNCSIDRITAVAGCSRVSFYQYFASKEDLFESLTGQVARQLNASAEALGELTADAEGWSTIRAWVGRHADIYNRYEPVFHAFQAASETDENVARGSVRWRDRNVARVRSRLVATRVPSRQLDAVTLLLLQTMTRTEDMARILRSAAPNDYGEERVGDALADVFHRTLFGFDERVNVHPPARRRPPALEFDPLVRTSFGDADTDELSEAGQKTLDTILAAGHAVFVERGYFRTRVDDVAKAAGLSHGAFYRYFENKDHLARVLTARAMQAVAAVFAELPDAVTADAGPASRTALRRWLRRYNAAQADEAAMLRVWVDASLQDATLRANSAPALDWGRRSIVSFLRPRHFGDIDTEALVLVGLLSAFGATARPPAVVDAAALVIEQGFLGR
jgi:AcrR family transcriptional regulator